MSSAVKFADRHGVMIFVYFLLSIVYLDRVSITLVEVHNV